MRLSTVVFVVSMLCSWLVADVLACKNDAVFIVKRAGKKASNQPARPTINISCGPPPGQRLGKVMPELKRRKQFPPWLEMAIQKTILTEHSCVLILKGTYNHQRLDGRVVQYINPILKVYRGLTEEDMKSVLLEVSNSKQVEQYIDGVFEWPAGQLKMNVYLLFVNMGVALDPNNAEDKAKYSALMMTTNREYQHKYGMIHKDLHMANSAHDYDSNSRLNLFDWAHARYCKVPGIGAPPSNWLEAFYWPGKSGGLPLPPKPIPDNLGTKGFSLLPTLEKNIINDKPVYLWGNAEANYYKLHKLVDGFPAVVKVSWVQGSRKHQYLYHEITNLIAVKCLLAGGQLRVDGAREISVVYFVMKFQGEMEVEGLTPERREELKREAMERYKTDFGMINTHPIDKYFIYGKDIDNKLKAYIYDWSSARHVDLPDGTLDYICPLPNKGYEDLRRIEKEYCSKDAARRSRHIKA